MVAPSTVASRLDVPIPLHDWWAENAPPEHMFAADAYDQQCHFVAYTLTGLFGSRDRSQTAREWPSGDLHALFKSICTVISTHTSKSVVLPVVRLVHPDTGLELVIRGNFHDWKVSVISSTPVIADFKELFDPNRQWTESFCEGFDPAWIFPPYAENKQKFTVELNSDYTLFAFVWILAHL